MPAPSGLQASWPPGFGPVASWPANHQKPPTTTNNQQPAAGLLASWLWACGLAADQPTTSHQQPGLLAYEPLGLLALGLWPHGLPTNHQSPTRHREALRSDNQHRASWPLGFVPVASWWTNQQPATNNPASWPISLLASWLWACGLMAYQPTTGRASRWRTSPWCCPCRCMAAGPRVARRHSARAALRPNRLWRWCATARGLSPSAITWCFQ